ncbi:protein NTM1-like 9 isoform X2 [Herrania umbratica]|nr:protein NTM1-like 9 isoform X2 [Herrania umbratica]
MIGDNDRTRHIREVDLLQREPWELPALSIVQSRYQEWLFFYKLNKISDRKTERTTQAGYWKSTGQDREIRDGGRLIGTKKTLVFFKGRTPRGVKTDWVMHEYRATADFVPPNAEKSYVVGFLRNKAAERTENLTSINGQPSSHLAASSSQSNSVGVAHMEVAPQPQSNSIDYEIALQTQFEDEGIFDYDLYDQSRMEEEGITLEDLPSNDQSWIDQPQSNSMDYDEQTEWQFQFDTIEQELYFMTSTFPDQDDRSYEETGYPLRPNYGAPDFAGGSSNTDLEQANAWRDQFVQHMSDGTGCGHSEGFYQKRMETGFHHDEVLIMDSSVDSATVTAHEINCLESVLEEKSVTRTCKSQYEPRTCKSVVQEHPRRVKLQGKSLGKAVSRDKARESGVRGPVVELARNKKSIVQSNKDPKMDRDKNTRSDLNSRSKGSAGSSRKNSFNSVEMSQLSCKTNPPLVYVGNVLLGVILFIFVVWEVLFLH